MNLKTIVRTTHFAVFFLAITSSAHGGLTVYFHGANNGGNPTQNLLMPIGESTLVASPVETDFWELRQSLSGGRFSHDLVLLTGDPDTAVEHVVLGNWQNHAFGQASGTSVAKAFANHLLSQKPEWFSGPIDLGGHSRGGGVIYDFARTLGQHNIGVEGLHFWDNHPVNGIEPQPYGTTDWGDSVPTHLDNVGFAVNYFQLNDANIPGKIVEGALNLDISGSGLNHTGVVSYFHGTVDLALERVVPNGRTLQDSWYDGERGARGNVGFQWTHLGHNPHQQPLAGIHPVLGGTGEIHLVEGMIEEDVWPWLGLTVDSRESLREGRFLVELAYSDPDTPATLAVIVGDSRDPQVGTEIHRELLAATTEKLVHTLDLATPDSPSGFLHFILDDGSNVKYTSAEYTLAVDLACDFDGNQSCDLGDIDQLMVEIATGTHSSIFDLDGDFTVNDSDRDEWLSLAANENGVTESYLVGDSNLDGTVSSADLNALALNWQKNRDEWSGGNFTGAAVNSADLNELALNWQQSVPLAAAQSVPEPSGILLLVVAGLFAGVARFKNSSGERR